MVALPNDAEIAQCVSIMNRIAPSDLVNLSPLLLEAGHALFGRSIKVSLFGEEDVVTFFKQKEDYKAILRKLERVHSEVQRAHADFVEVRHLVGILQEKKYDRNILQIQGYYNVKILQRVNSTA